MRAEDNSQMTTLSQQSFEVVMTAIKNAKLKGHSQVQPLHVAAALLDPFTRSTALHNACLQSLKKPQLPQQPQHSLEGCDALDLCFKVALERLPVITDPEKCKEQTMSNALGAALKRAHANERRGTPEQSLQPLLAVKTGIAHLTISILDDPSVSRVFREAGFSSTDVKLNMEEQVAKAALAGPVPPSLENSGARRMQVTMPRFCGARPESVQFRSSFFSGPLAVGDPSSNHGKLLERGRMSGNGMDVLAAERESSLFGSGIARQDPDGVSRSFGSTPPKFLEYSQQKREGQPWMAGRLTDNTSSNTNRHEADIRSIVEAILSGPKKKNPVLVSDSGPNSVVKEFSQRLMRGDTPNFLPGVRVLDLPFTSLSVGFLSQEVFEQKLAKLKRDVDGYIQTGGAILSVGDCQWLLAPSHSLSSLVVQELQQMVNSNADNRFWLLATASSTTWERCRDHNQPLLQSLALHPVLLAPDNPGSGLQLRHGSHYGIKNGEVPYLSQTGGGKLADFKPASIQSRPEKIDCCADCNIKFQQECSTLIKEEQTLCLGSSPAYSKLIWLQNQNQKSSTALSVKEEESVVTNKIEVLREKWQQQCSTHHLHRAFSRDHSASPVAEIVSPQERNPRMSVPVTLNPSRWVPHPVKISDEKSSEFLPLHARIARGNMPNILSGSKPVISSKNGELETKRGDESSASPLSFLRRDAGGVCGPTLSMRPNVLIGKSGLSGASVGTDLALGRSATIRTRDLREDGQQPLHNRLQPPNNNPKSFKIAHHSALVRPSDAENLNGLCWTLSKAVVWQKEAVGVIAATVMKCRSGDGRKTGPYARTDTWFMFLGPDRVGKREVAKALAKLVFYHEENLISVTGWRTDATGRTASTAGILAADNNGMKYRGKTPLDRLAEALQRKPLSVVLLEDIDRADSTFKRNLVKAMDRGRLVDSSGREVSLLNVIVIMTCGAGASLLSNHLLPPGNRALEFDEDSLFELGPHGVRMFKDTIASVNVLHTRGKGLSIVDSIKTEQVQDAVKEDKQAESILLFGSHMFKRKADAITQGEHMRCSQSPPGKVCKREESSPSRAFSLDLNLSVEENLSEDEEPCITEEFCEESEPKSLEELTAKVIKSARGECPVEMFCLSDATVVFKPFNLNALTDWVFDRLETALEEVMPTEKVPVEIDRALLEVMVSFAWKNFSNPDAFQSWVDMVLMRAVSGLLEKGPLPPDAIVKLMAVETPVTMTMTPEFTDSGSLVSKVDLLPRLVQVDQ